MDHTPAVSAGDDRALRLLERAPVPEAHRDRLLAAVRKAQALASAAAADLQAEFGPEHVGLIAEHNQFLRLFRGGAHPGAIDVWLDEAAKAQLREAGFELQPPEGAVFRLFGWVRIDPMQGPQAAVEDAVAAAFSKARSA